MAESVVGEVIASIFAVNFVTAICTIDCKASFSYPVVNGLLKVLNCKGWPEGTVGTPYAVFRRVRNSFVVGKPIIAT